MSRLFRTSATSITLWTAILTLQAQTLLDLKSQGRNVDFSGAVATKPFRVGTALPAVCNVGEAFFKSDAPPGSNLYTCTATNTWTVQSGSGGSASLPVTTNLVKGNGAGGATVANPGADYYKPGMVISSIDLPPNVATTDAQNTFSDPGNQYFGKYDVACDATGVSADNVLVKKSGAACIALTTSDTGIDSGLVGLLISGSTTANGRVRKFGVGDCIAVGTINAGYWIKPSTTTAGACEGSSSRPLAGTVIIGRANGPAGATVPVDVMIDPNSASGSSGSFGSSGSSGSGDHSLADNTTAITVTNDNTAHTLSWDTTVSDSGGLHETVTHPDRFTINNAGWYSFSCQVTPFTIGLASGNSIFEVRILKNGATVVASYFFDGGVTSNTFRADGVGQLSATDYLTCDVRTNSPGNASLLSGVHYTYMQVSAVTGGSSSSGAPLDSPAFTGTPTAPTPTQGDNSTKLATTAYVNAAVSGVSGGTSACTTTLASGTNQIGGALAAGARICVTGNQTQNTNAISVTQSNVTIACVPGTSIQQATASSNLFNITGDNFQMEGCTLKPVSSGTAGQLVKISGNHSKLTNVKFDISGSTATNGGAGWWRVTGGSDHQVIDSYVIASTDDAFFAAGDDAAVSRVVWRNINCELNADNHYCFNTALGANGVGIIGAFNNTCWTVGGCTHFVTNTGDYQLIGNKGYRTGSGSVNMFSNFAGVNAVYADNLCNDQGHAIGGPFTICFADHDSTGTAFHHNVAVMTGGAGNPFSFYDARGLDIDGNIAKGTIDTSTGQYANGTFGWDAAQPCITIINQSTSADNSYNRIRSNTCYLPPSFSGKGINLACTLTGGLKCNDTKISGNILIGTGAGVGIEVDQADSNTVAGVDISDNRLVSLATGIKTTGGISKLRVGANSWTSVTTPWSFGASAKALLTDPFPVTFANLPTNVLDGSQVYASDANATCTAGSGTGRTCFRENGTWTH